MLRFLLAAALLLHAAGCASPPPPAPTRPPPPALDDALRARLDPVLQSLVRLDGPNGTACAMAIRPDGMAVTAWHVVQGSFFSSRKNGGPPEMRSLFSGRYRNQPFSNPTLVAACPEQDVAILDLGIPTPVHVSPSPRGFARGERVFLVGASSGSARLSEVARMKATSDPRQVLFLMDAAAFPGDSGGGVVNEQGEWLGVLVRASPRNQARESGLPPWDWVSVLVPIPARVLDDILRARPQQPPTRLYLDPDPAEGKIDPLRFWQSIRFSAD